MPDYICEKCKKFFTKKSAYSSHMMRINSCIKNTNINNECMYCNKKFANKYILNSHLNICKTKITYNQIDELKTMLFKQKKDNQELKKKIEELSHINETNNNININKNSNNNITTNNTFNIFSSGKEDLSLLSKEDIIKLCTSGTYYPIEAAKILHCNEKYPEFQNILISNLRATTGKVKINNKWVTKSQDEVLNNMMNVDKRHISSLIKDLEVDDKLKIKLESTQDEIDTNEPKEHQKSKIKNILHDASNMIKKNKSLDKILLK